MSTIVSDPFSIKSNTVSEKLGSDIVNREMDLSVKSCASDAG